MIQGILPVLDLAELPRLNGGVIRHSLDHGDEIGIENVALNNLLAARNRLATDIYGNKFEAQFVLPIKFWDMVLEGARSVSVIPEFLPRDRFGGILNIITMSTLHRWDGHTVLLYTPHNETVWELQVGEQHELARREECLALLGPNKGFDLIVPYLPALGVAGPESYKALGYAPPQIQEQWIAEGYESPKNALAQIGQLPALTQKRMLAEWDSIGYPLALNARILQERGLLAPEIAGALPAPEPTEVA